MRKYSSLQPKRKKLRKNSKQKLIPHTMSRSDVFPPKEKEKKIPFLYLAHFLIMLFLLILYVEWWGFQRFYIEINKNKKKKTSFDLHCIFLTFYLKRVKYVLR